MFQVRISACCIKGNWSDSAPRSSRIRPTRVGSAWALNTDSGSTIASRNWSRVIRGVRNWLSLIASGSPWNRSQFPRKSDRIVITT